MWMRDYSEAEMIAIQEVFLGATANRIVTFILSIVGRDGLGTANMVEINKKMIYS